MKTDQEGNEVVPIQAHNQFRNGRIRKDWAEEAYKEYQFKYSNDQTFERLHQRGGFGAEELIWLLVERCRRLEQGK